MGHQRDERHLADERALAGHVGAGDQPEEAAVGAECRVVGDEHPVRQDLVEHRVAAVLDFDHRPLDEHRPRVVAGRRQLRQRRQEVHGRQHVGGVQESVRLGGHLVADLQEQLQLQRLALVLGREHLLLVLLQLGRVVPLGVLERPLADVVRRHLRGVGVRHLDVVPGHLVVRDLQAGDPRAGDLLRLVAGDPALPLARQLPQLV